MHASDGWTWVAHYRDGSALREDDGHVFADIDQTQVTSFLLLPRREGLAAVAVQLQDGQRLVFFRRRTFDKSLATGEEYNHATFHCLGWESDSGSSYTFLNTSGAVLTTSDREAV